MHCSSERIRKIFESNSQAQVAMRTEFRRSIRFHHILTRGADGWMPGLLHPRNIVGESVTRTHPLPETQ